MHFIRVILLIVLAVIGCGKSSPPQHIQAWVESWGKMGMYLPNEDEITFLRANFRDVKPELAAAISHENPDVRQRAAYVIGKIGPEAKSLGPDLVQRLKTEKERLVRIYLVNALSGIKFQDKEATNLLRSRFDSLKSVNTAPQLFGGYSDVDEKIDFAAALYNLTPSVDRQKYLDFVTQWLKPPSADFSAVEKEGYWERRWMAVIALEGMPDAKSAIPLLDAMLHEDGAKDWVSVHVPRVLGVLKQSGT